MKNKNLSLKLASYASLSAGLLIAGVSTEAQVIYTDIADINVTPTSGLHLIDLNNDGVNDLSMNFNHFSSFYMGMQFDGDMALVSPLNNNEFAVDSSSSSFIRSFPSSSIIDLYLNQPNTIWQGLNSSSSGSYKLLKGVVSFSMAVKSSKQIYSFGWADGTTAYAALKFDISGNMHYAWLRFRVDSVQDYTLLDYAYQATAGDSIITGETGVSVDEYDYLDADVYSYSDIISINNASNANYGIYNLSGQLIDEGKIPNDKYSLKIENKGVFVIRLSKDNKQFTKKVVL